MSSLAMAYAMKKRSKKMAEGGEVAMDDTPMSAEERKKRLEASMRKAFHYAKGGDVECDYDDEMVGRIMKSRGGMIANESEPVADFEENQFDDLVLRDSLEFSDTGANSGDEIGDDQEDEDRKDIVRRIMRSRSKKDHNLRPA